MPNNPFMYTRIPSPQADYPVINYFDLAEERHTTSVMRAILVDWLVEVQENFQLYHETLYVAVKLLGICLVLDFGRFLSLFSFCHIHCKEFFRPCKRFFFFLVNGRNWELLPKFLRWAQTELTSAGPLAASLYYLSYFCYLAFWSSLIPDF